MKCRMGKCTQYTIKNKIHNKHFTIKTHIQKCLLWGLFYVAFVLSISHVYCLFECLWQTIFAPLHDSYLYWKHADNFYVKIFFSNVIGLFCNLVSESWHKTIKMCNWFMDHKMMCNIFVFLNDNENFNVVWEIW